MNPLKSLKTIKSRWEFFEKMCLEGVSDQQRREARVSFYAGVTSLARLQEQLSLDALTEDEIVLVVQAWRRELDIFKEEQLANFTAARN